MKKNSRTKILNFTAKVVLVLLFIFIIYKQVFDRDNVNYLIDELWVSIEKRPFFIVFVVLLMLVNLGLESMKWKVLVSKFEKTTFLNSFKTILVGVTTGIVTPAKLGEYFGRMLLLDSKNNWKAIWATFISSIAQNIATILFGIFGLTYFLRRFYDIESTIIDVSFYLGLTLVVVLLFLYYNIDLGLRIIRRLGLRKFADKIMSKDDSIKQFADSSILNKVLIFSLLRYLVFALQYYLLLVFFGVEGDVTAVFAAITVVYLIQTSIPLPPITNIFARGEIAILVFSHFTGNEIMILSSTFSLWIINLLIPATIGMFIIFKINVVKSLGYD